MRLSNALFALFVAAPAGCLRIECDDHNDCASDEVCWSGSCEPIIGRAWTVEIASASVDIVHPDGMLWDEDGSPPDLYAEFGFTSDACLTSYVPESFDPVWYESCDFYVAGGELFYIDLWDVDLTGDELGTSYEWDGTEAFIALARQTAGLETSYVDPSGTALVWFSLWPL